MSSKGAIKWLARLKEPRTIESLISEVYGAAAWYGCLFEHEVADLLNFYEMMKSFQEFNTKDWTLNQLIKEVEKRHFLTEEQLSALSDAKDARNELVHRLIAKRLVVSRADQEIFLAEIDALYFRVWSGHRLASHLKQHFASEVGFTDAKVQAAVNRLKDEASIEDENIRRLIRDEPNEA